MTQKHTTREAWLAGAVELMVPLFEQHQYKVPKVRVACGWPNKGGTSSQKRTIGQCWSPDAASDGVIQIFISPWLEDVTGSQGVLSTLVHEVVHAVVGNKERHNKVFGKCARAVGLEGKLTSTHAGEPLLMLCAEWSGKLGVYAHGKLDLTKSPVKKQSTRMIKCECHECGYVCRTSQKWIDAAGAPVCPVKGHGEMCATKPAKKDEGEGDDE